MKLVVLSAVVLYSTHMVLALRQHSQQILTIDDLHRSPIPGLIPGGSPFKHCSNDTSKDLFQMDWFTMSPSEPVKSEYLKMVTHGNFTRDLGRDAILNVTLFSVTTSSGTSYSCPLWWILQKIERDQDSSIAYRLRWSQEDYSATASEPPRPTWPPKMGAAKLTYEVEVPWVFDISEELIEVVAEAFNADGARIFCLMGSMVFNPQDEEDS